MSENQEHCKTWDKKVKLSHYRHEGDKGESMHSSYSFLTLALNGVSGYRHAPAELYPPERTLGTHWIGGWVGLRAGLDTEATGKILFLCLRSSPVRPFAGPEVRSWNGLLPVTMWELCHCIALRCQCFVWCWTIWTFMNSMYQHKNESAFLFKK
jgi:hypothetical protein